MGQGVRPNFKSRHGKGGAAAKDGPPPPPLDEETLERIRNLLRENGGIVPLGKICHDFLGLKKCQLEGHFLFSRVGDQWQVGLPELDDGTGSFQSQAVAAAMVSGNPGSVAAAAQTGFGAFAGGLDGLSSGLSGVPPEMQLGSLGAPAAAMTGVAAATVQEMAGVQGAVLGQEQVTPLDPSQVEEIATYLEQHGGALPMGRLTQHFMRLKRAQLETYFELSQVGQHGQWEVRLPGMESQGAEIVYQGKALPSDAQLPPLTESQITAVTNTLALSPNHTLSLMELLKHVPGIKRKQLEEHFQVLQIDKKRFDISLNGPPGRVDTRKANQNPQQGQAGGVAQEFSAAAAQMQAAVQAQVLQVPKSVPAEEAPPPLEPEVVAQVTALLEACGGETWMGKVSQNFKHIRRAQLEPHFEFARLGDQWLVRLPGLASRGGQDLLAGQSQLKGGGFVQPGMRGVAVQPGPCFGKGMGARGHVAAAPQMMQGRAGSHPMSKILRPRNPRGKDGEELQPLSEEVLQGIAVLVEAEGGTVTMGHVSQAFVGVKRAQLDGHFDMTREGDQWRITLPAWKRQRLV